ncbi:MAG TPA: hypothetical protein VMV87_07940, partial [Burkholderiales bacterium]|nr:hypothetical protein [Burkholderiales bacterium]
GCWNSQTVIVQSAQQVFGNDMPTYGYIVVNRGGNPSGAQTDSAQEAAWPGLDWNAPAESNIHGAGQTGGDWWSSLFDAPLLSAEDLARQSGLTVKKPH